MREITLDPLPGNATDSQKIDWCVRMIQQGARASAEDPIKVFDSYSSDTTPTVTRALNVSSPTTSNIVAVIATLIADMRRRGVNRSGG